MTSGLRQVISLFSNSNLYPPEGSAKQNHAPLRFLAAEWILTDAYLELGLDESLVNTIEEKWLIQ